MTFTTTKCPLCKQIIDAKQPAVKSSIQNYLHKLFKMFIPTLLDLLLMSLLIIAAAFFRFNRFPCSCKYSFQLFDFNSYISNRPNNKIPKHSTTNFSNHSTLNLIPSNDTLSKMNTIDKETNTEESKPVILIWLCRKRKTIVFKKKLHENVPKELLHVMCLLCYQYVIKDVGYGFCPKCSKLNFIFPIFNWFQCDICKQTRFHYSVAKTFHHSDHKPVNFCKFCIKDFNLCPLCEKMIT